MIARQSYPSFITSDINECSNGSHVCDVNTNCTNAGGSYNCTWKRGYTGDGRRCQGTCCNFYYHLWMYFFLTRTFLLVPFNVEITGWCAKKSIEMEVLGFVAFFTGNRTSREHFSSDFQFFKLQKLFEHFIRIHLFR